MLFCLSDPAPSASPSVEGFGANVVNVIVIFLLSNFPFGLFKTEYNVTLYVVLMLRSVSVYSF